MRPLLFLGLFLSSVASVAQMKATEYFSSNGEYRLVCVPAIDTASAYNVLYKKGDKEPLWERFGLQMQGLIGVSNSGKVAWFGDICSQYHQSGVCIKTTQPDSMVLRVGNLQIKLGRILSERLYELPVDPANNPIGILLNDTIIHKMAENPFFIDEDKLFVSTKPATLNVFDINTGEVIYVGPGRNHFTQNYYSIPAPPYKQLYGLPLPEWSNRHLWLKPQSSNDRPSALKAE